ncbi:asparaginase [Azonexus fungiphilus]|uniref:asparaginase n=1 Tax=Azonexus fungiphilus TaxID=146940 RepID=A0A495VP07_9RHOO|nr:type I asparaginase [Azonexus fungiphilus]NHC06712.1 type I asparaginase [Azonexus fungiphilus]RKT51139.1 asparaginase [Azonexus fungiphilus]
MPPVLILHTGGTIGMAATPGGYRPLPGFAGHLRRQLAGRGEFTVVELPPIDSADLRPGHWSAIATALAERWHDHAGFVVLHGTDTMAWSASALSFMLRGCDKPVVFTGAQIPMGEPASDALANLAAALDIAAASPLREVAIAFGPRLLRGNRARKLSATRLDAFDSPNCPALAELGTPPAFHVEQLRPAGRPDFRIAACTDGAVGVLTFYPGISAASVDALLADPRLRGLVLQSYGTGNAPQADPALLGALERAAARGVVMLNTTQCAHGSVAQETYATGAALAGIGVVGGADITPEAAFAKLHWLLASDSDPARIAAALRQSLAGEQSVA